MNESFAELFEQSNAFKSMIPGSIVIGKVVDIRSEAVVVNAGLKSEGIIPIREFHNQEGELEVSLGDEVEVALDAIEDGFGETILSREKAKRAMVWDKLEKLQAADEIIKGKITGRVKGGFTVDIEDVRAFLPGSLVDVKPIKDLTYLEDKELEFKLIKLDRRRNNIVVSRRAVIEMEYGAEREALLSNLTEGSVVKGVVKNLTDYGAFLDLGGVDGLLHITDMSWKRIKHPSEVVNLGDEMDVCILRFDKDKSRVSLGLKQLGEDPWIDIARRYPTGARLFGKISNITDYGCFVEIEEGVEGLVHVSELDWTNKNVVPSKIVQLGDEVEVVVLDIDEERRRISLGIKQCKPNPWAEFSASHQINDRVTGIIKSITDFGVFIELEGGVDGLIHLSDIAWHGGGNELLRDYKKGDEIEAILLAVDADRERISLGIKQLAEDPFNNYITANPKGSILKGKVVKIEPRGMVVELAQGIHGYIRTVDIAKERVSDPSEMFKEEDIVEAKFVSLDRKSRQLNLSIKAKESDELAEVLEEYQGKDSTATTKLGEVLKQELDKK